MLFHLNLFNDNTSNVSKRSRWIGDKFFPLLKLDKWTMLSSPPVVVVFVQWFNDFVHRGAENKEQQPNCGEFLCSLP